MTLRVGAMVARFHREAMAGVCHCAATHWRLEAGRTIAGAMGVTVRAEVRSP